MEIKELNSLKSTVALNNGIEMPILGYGTYLTPAEETREAVGNALEAGYRHIDTAAVYGNEAAVGEAIRESGIPREQIFVTTKLWNTDRGYRSATDAFNRSLETLQLDYLDLYLIHWPANKKQFGLEAGGINAETWQAFEDLYKQGRVRAIGLSNFLTHHIQALYETATVNPQVNQIECHPGFLQQDTVRFCLDNDILPEAWSPLGRRAVLDNRVLAEIGAAHQKTAAQIALRWELQHNVVPLPKTVHKNRMIENADLFNFELSSEEMQRIDNLPFMGQGKNPDTIDF